MVHNTSDFHGVYGQPAVKTTSDPLGHKAQPSMSPEERRQGPCKGPISCKGG